MLAVAAASLWLGAGCDPHALNGGSCAVGGTVYQDGASGIRASDGCNTCTCSHGELVCTLIACPVAKACGARAGNTCAANEYCAYTEGSYCGAADAEAVCMTRPSACDSVYAPVCGCDGQTYASSCMAAQAGSGVLHAGPCSKACGGFAGLTCSASEYCAYVEGQLCGAADASATCMPRPDGCTTDFNPVCGCDGNTYSNACAAAQAGFGYSHNGACAPQ